MNINSGNSEDNSFLSKSNLFSAHNFKLNTTHIRTWNMHAHTHWQKYVKKLTEKCRSYNIQSFYMHITYKTEAKINFSLAQTDLD